MKIFINDNLIDFELTDEKSVPEVLQALEQWVSEQQLFLTQIVIDDERVEGFGFSSPTLTEKSLKSYPKFNRLEEVKEIRCEVLSAVAYVVSVWSELKLCFEPFKKITIKEVEQQSSDILTCIEWSKAIIAKINQFFGSIAESALLLKLIKALELEIFKLKKNPQESLASLTQLIKQIDQEIEQGLFVLNTKVIKSGLKEDPVAIRHSIENYIIYLELVEEKLVEVAIHFQKTQITQGFASLASVSDGLGIFFVLAKQIDKEFGNTLSEKKTDKINFRVVTKAGNELQTELKKYLDALSEAISNNDYIDSADIVEYEIKELIPQVSELLNKYLKLIKQPTSNEIK